MHNYHFFIFSVHIPIDQAVRTHAICLTLSTEFTITCYLSRFTSSVPNVNTNTYIMYMLLHCTDLHHYDTRSPDPFQMVSSQLVKTWSSKYTSESNHLVILCSLFFHIYFTTLLNRPLQKCTLSNFTLGSS